MSPRRTIGWRVLAAYRLGSRVAGKAFSLAASGAFAGFGAGSVIQPPVRLVGEGRIHVGTRVFVGSGCWLNAMGSGPDPILVIGDGTKIVGDVILSAATRVELGEKVLIARGAYISDHSHEFRDPSRAVLDQGITGLASVHVGAGAWLGENVVVGPGVTIGQGAVIGANSVVLSDVPPYCVAVGAPARVVREFAA